MAKTSTRDVFGKDADFFLDNGGYPTPPWVILRNLSNPVLDLCAHERAICRILLDYRYQLSAALMDMDALAHEFGKSLRQTRRWIAKLRAKELIKVIFRPGRPSIIDVSPLVIAVKKLVGWEEAEQPAPVETLVEVVAEPTEEELFWLQAADSEEDAATEAEEAEEDVGAYLDWQRLVEHIDRRGHLSRGQRKHLDDTKGLRWEGLTLIVQARDKGQMRFLEMLDATISLSVLDVFGLDYEVQFEPEKRKKPKKLGPLARLAVAAVGV